MILSRNVRCTTGGHIMHRIGQKRAGHDREAGSDWTNRYPDCRKTGLFGMDSTQMATHLCAPGAGRFHEADRTTCYRPIGHGLARFAGRDSSPARDPSWLGTRYHSDRTAIRCVVGKAGLTQSLTGSSLPQTCRTDTPLPEAC
jgi:hypothetical protein